MCRRLAAAGGGGGGGGGDLGQQADRRLLCRGRTPSISPSLSVLTFTPPPPPLSPLWVFCKVISGLAAEPLVSAC